MGELHRLFAFDTGPKKKMYLTSERCDAIKAARTNFIRKMRSEGYINRNGFWVKN